MSSGPAGVQCAQLKEQANNCLIYLRGLKATVLTLQERVHEPLSPGTTIEDLQHSYDKLSKRVDDYYHKIEQYALQLPDKVPSVDPLNKIAQVFQDDQTPGGRDSLDSMMDAANWNESYYQFMCYTEQFCRQSFKRKPSVYDNRTLKFSTWNQYNSPHVTFEQALHCVQKEMFSKKMGIWTKILERSAFGCVVEMKVGVIVDKQSVVQQKMLFVENLGVIEMLIFVAPHEEWRYLDDYGEYGGRKLDLVQTSRYVVYQKLTAQANQSLHLLLNSMDVRSHVNHQVATTLQIFSRYHKLFETKCRICGNVMKDFLPCVMYDPRQPTHSFHEACR